MTAGRRRGDALDRYDTPADVTEHFLSLWRPRARIRSIIEPAAGSGSMLAPLLRRFPGAELIAADARPRSKHVALFDYLAPRVEPNSDRVDLVFTNPPFIHALEFADRAIMDVRRGGYVVLLLRAGFIESKRRNGWLREHMPDVWFLRDRPRFYGGATDSAIYGWFIWRNDPRWLRRRAGEWRII